MAPTPRIQVRGFDLNEVEEKLIQRHLGKLQRRLSAHGEPIIQLVMDWHPYQRMVRARMRVQLGHLGQHIVSARAAETANLAVERAVDSIERQFKRKLAVMKGEPSYGVPSRREPPLQPETAAAEEEELEEAEAAALAEWPADELEWEEETEAAQ